MIAQGRAAASAPALLFRHFPIFQAYEEETAAMNEHCVIDGTIAGVVYQNEENGYTVLRLVTTDGEAVTVVGSIPCAAPGEDLIVTGHWVSHPVHGDQVQAERVERHLPTAEDEILRYLSSGVIKGIGAVTAARLVQRFGGNTLTVLEEDPDQLTQIKGITPRKAEEICESYRYQTGMRRLMDFLNVNDLPLSLALRLYQRYGGEALDRYRAALAQVVDFWDFSITPVSYDSRYFYDAAHFRNAVGTMMLAEIFGDDSVYRPEDFGTFITAENCRESSRQGMPQAEDPAAYTVEVPILMYHHFSGDEEGAVTPPEFASHLEALRDGGYTAVFMEDLIDYVYRGGELPDKPVCITFDDGYLSNYEIAWPLLEQYGMKATIFAIGSSVGHEEFYKDTQFRLTPHFSYEQAREMTASGAVDFQSHTYDLHQWAPFESGDRIRASALPLPGEREEDYAVMLENDMEIYDRERRRELGEGFSALAYPGGYYNVLTEVLIHQAGIPVTLSIETDRPNVLVRGLPQSLYALCRWNVTAGMTGEEVLAMIGGT